MQEWVLIISLFTPGGDFMDKRHIVLPDQQACQRAKMDVETADNPMGVKVKTLCVTKAHWTGQKPMRGVPLD